LSSYATITGFKSKYWFAYFGTPIAPTATASTSTTQIATTEYVTDAISTSENKFYHWLVVIWNERDKAALLQM
jgi:hypothetical protein